MMVFFTSFPYATFTHQMAPPKSGRQTDFG